MLIGYELSCYDNDSFMFSDLDPKWPRCPECGYTLDFNYNIPFNSELICDKMNDLIYFELERFFKEGEQKCI